MLKLFLIGLFGALGALARYGLTYWMVIWFGTSFPWATLLANVVGCFIIGCAYEIEHEMLPVHWKQIIGVGFLGALTTFSAFGYDTFMRLEAGDLRGATGNILANLALGLVAVWLGVTAVRGSLAAITP